MMPCDLCSTVDEQGRRTPFDKNGNPLRGLRQVGKTKRDGPRGERVYRCQDCGALWRSTSDVSTLETTHRPLLRLLEGGAEEVGR